VGGIKKMSFGGSWYPAKRSDCEDAILSYRGRGTVRDMGRPCVGGILPHAGWLFSGKTAFSVLATIGRSTSPDVIFIFGMHLPPGSRSSLYLDEGFETPFGVVPVHREAAARLAEALDFAVEDAASARPENTIELQLPFVRYVFPDVSVVTAGIAPGDAEQAGERAASIAREMGLRPLFIGSTDLTHYGPNYGFAPHGTGFESVTWVKEENDRRIVDAFLAMEPRRIIEEALRSRNACCPGAAAAAVAGARRSGAREGCLLEYTTSYDVMPGSSFVGYAGVVF
jgi:AmmeMemoRadiSam system protein B